MDREIIETFIKIAQVQTFTAAANLLYVSQSTISHRLKMLEDHLGIILFVRQRGQKKLTLTKKGEQFYPLAQRWLDLDEMMHQIKSTPTYWRVRVGGLDSIYQYLLPPLLHKLCKQEPDLRLELYSYHSNEIYRRLVTREIDIGFAFYPIHYSDIIATPVFQEPVVMITPKNSIYPIGNIHPNQLKHTDEVFFPWDVNLLQWHNKWWDTFDPPYLRVDSSSLMINFLTEPQNWSMCPESIAVNFESRGLVDIHLFSEAPPNRVCYMLTRKKPGSFSNKAINAFTNSFFQLLVKHPWRYDQIAQSTDNITGVDLSRNDH